MRDLRLYLSRITANIRRKNKVYRKKFRRFRKVSATWILARQPVFKELGAWLANLFLFGILLNIPMAWVFGWPIGLKTFIGWGLIGYIAKVELPGIIRHMFPFR